jgi:hypothetical protein
MEGYLIPFDFDLVRKAMPLIVALCALIFLIIVNRERPRSH